MGVTKDPSAAMHTPPSASASGQGRNLQWATPQSQLPHAQLKLNDTPTSSTKSVALSSSVPALAVASPQTPGTGRHRQNLPTPSPARTNPLTQKEPGADEYISRLLRLARGPHAQRANSSSPMADFLASLGFGGAQSPAASNNPQCDSVEQLQHKLRGILDAKVTPTRAEHVAITIELRATVRFQLPVSESENGNQENLNGLDQLQSAGADGHQDAGQLSRVVFANDTLMNQPQDDPSLQRSVAKHIISTISSTDGSTWTVREVSRGTQGWTFTYLCKDSFQCWNRQNAKNPVKTIVGEFSQREPDPVLHARPAFDCRGSIVIAFDRSSRAITIKYDHTPLHKTVAELAAHFKPPPRQLGPGAQKIQEQQQKAKEKTPKKPRGEKKDKKEQKKRESTTKAQDENGNPRKRKRKSNAAQPAEATDGPMIPPDYPGAPAVNGQADMSYMNGVQALADAAQQGFNDYPQGLMGDGPGATNGTVSQQPGGQPGSATFPVNVSAAEANRRKEAATSMLSNAGVDPTTLSPEQFGIFSNQAPELQRESLSMLVKYGAERLRIVHPSNREGSAQASASTAQSTPSSNGPRTTKELVPQPSAQSNVNTDTEAQTVSPTADEASTPKRKAMKLGKSRTACFPCKARKTKCPKERPTCTECANHGTACEYAPHKPRNRGKSAKKSEAIVVDDDEEEEDEEEEEEQVEEEEQEDAEDAEGAENAEEEEDQDDDDQQANSQDYSYPQMNIGNMVTNTDTTPQNTHATQNYYQPAPGLAMPQTDPYSTTSQPLSTTSSQRNNYSHALPEAMQPVHHPPPPVPAPAGTIAPSETRRWTAFGSGGLSSASGSSKARRSLPSEPQHSNGQSVPTTNPQPSDWAQSTNTTMPAMPATTMASVSPQMSYDNRSGHGGRQKNQSLSNDSAQQAAAMASTVMQQAQAQAQARQSPVATAAMTAQARKSPYQQVAVPRTTSRTGQRNQSRTPVTDQARGYQPPPPVDMSQQHTSRTNTHYDTSHMPSGSGYNDYGRYGGSNAVASQQQAMSVAQATPNTMSTSYQTTPSTTANQWSGSSSQNDRSYGTNSSYQAPNMYTQSSAAKAAPASRQNFNVRSSAQQQQHTRGSSGSCSQQQPQQQANYSSYSGSTHQNQPSQTSNQPQQQQQPPSWYFQNSHNSSIHAGSQSSGYNYEPWSGV